MKNTITKSIVIGIIGGMFASWVKAIVEPPLQKLGEENFPPSDSELSLRGADVSNQPENMPPAVLAGMVYQDFTGKSLSKKDKIATMPYIHYGLGAMIGVVYTMVVEKNKQLTFDEGITSGIVIWGLTHGSVVPALGLQGSVKDMPKSWWVWEFGSHIVFGVALEQSRKVLNTILD